MRNVAYKAKKDTGINISQQTIWKTGYLNIKTKIKTPKTVIQDIYIFDVEWIKIKGIWNLQIPLLFNSKQNIIVADEIYSKENSKNIKDFLEQNTMNKNKISITTDLDEKYKPIIEKLGFKHQWCYFHALKKFNKTINRIYPRK